MPRVASWFRTLNPWTGPTASPPPLKGLSPAFPSIPEAGASTLLWRALQPGSKRAHAACSEDRCCRGLCSRVGWSESPGGWAEDRPKKQQEEVATSTAIAASDLAGRLTGGWPPSEHLASGRVSGVLEARRSVWSQAGTKEVSCSGPSCTEYSQRSTQGDLQVKRG